MSTRIEWGRLGVCSNPSWRLRRLSISLTHCVQVIILTKPSCRWCKSCFLLWWHRSRVPLSLWAHHEDYGIFQSVRTHRVRNERDVNWEKDSPNWLDIRKTRSKLRCTLNLTCTDTLTLAQTHSLSHALALNSAREVRIRLYTPHMSMQEDYLFESQYAFFVPKVSSKCFLCLSEWVDAWGKSTIHG